MHLYLSTILRINAVLAAKNRTKTLCTLCFHRVLALYIRGTTGFERLLKNVVEINTIALQARLIV